MFELNSQKMYYSFAFAVTILCPLISVVPTYSMDDFNKSSNSTMAQCIIHNEMYWKLIPWFYGKLTFVDIFAISLPHAPEPINQLSSIFLHAMTESKFFLMQILPIPGHFLFINFRNYHSRAKLQSGIYTYRYGL